MQELLLLQELLLKLVLLRAYSLLGFQAQLERFLQVLQEFLLQVCSLQEFLALQEYFLQVPQEPLLLQVRSLQGFQELLLR